MPAHTAVAARDLSSARVPLLGPAHVHVWRASLITSNIRRDRYMTARGILREILALYLRCAPRSLTFQTNLFGKPALGFPYSASDLRFNLSHAHDTVLYAITWGRDVGIDIEDCTANHHVDGIASGFFSPAENLALQSLPETIRSRAFYATWTRKEAFIKARGEGLTVPLKGFTVSVRPDEPARLIAADRRGELERWSMVSLPVESRYEAALVVEGSGCELIFRDWPNGQPVCAES